MLFHYSNLYKALFLALESRSCTLPKLFYSQLRTIASLKNIPTASPTELKTTNFPVRPSWKQVCYFSEFVLTRPCGPKVNGFALLSAAFKNSHVECFVFILLIDRFERKETMSLDGLFSNAALSKTSSNGRCVLGEVYSSFVSVRCDSVLSHSCQSNVIGGGGVGGVAEKWGKYCIFRMFSQRS